MCVCIVLSPACHLLMLINILDHKSSQEKAHSSEETSFSNIKRHRISEEGLNLLWTVFVHHRFQKLPDLPSFKLRVQTDMHVLYGPKFLACGRHTTCRSPWQFLPSIPNSQLQQMLLPLPGKGHNIISVLVAIWSIKTQQDLRDLSQVAQEGSASITD